MSRFHCEFKYCNCNCYVSNKGKCLDCKHAKLWHSRHCKESPTDGYLQFTSQRKKARRPIYVSDIQFAEIFIPTIPTVPPLPDNIVSLPFCYCVEVLPV